MDKFSYLSNGHGAAIEDSYNQYLVNPESVEPGWRSFFEGFEFARKNYDTVNVVPDNITKEFQVVNLINLYRSTGHLFTKTNPVRERRKYSPSLDDIHLIGLGDIDMETEFQAGNQIGLGPAKLKDIIAFLKKT